MKKIQFGQAIGILANVGVIASIVFLAIELHQNNEQLELQIREEYAARRNSVLDIVLQYPGLLALFEKQADQLTEIERDRLTLLGIKTILVWEEQYCAISSGLQDEDETIRAIRAIYGRQRLNYGTPLAWETYKLRADGAFIEWMEKNVIQQ